MSVGEILIITLSYVLLCLKYLEYYYVLRQRSASQRPLQSIQYRAISVVKTKEWRLRDNLHQRTRALQLRYESRDFMLCAFMICTLSAGALREQGLLQQDQGDADRASSASRLPQQVL